MFNMVTDADHPIQGFTTAWITHLARLCKSVHVITMLKGRLELPDNVSVTSVGKELGYGKLRRAANFYRQLWQVEQYGAIDACFAHMIPIFTVLGAPLLKANRIPITLWHAHGSTPPVLRIAEKVVDNIVTASEESFRIPSSKVIVTGHGIDTQHFVPSGGLKSQARPFTITSVSRIAPIKRLDILLEAIKLVVNRYGLNDLRVRIVGGVYPHDSEYAADIERYIRKEGLGRTVLMVGPVSYSDVVQEYQQADLFVNLSETGSLDKAVLESMSCAVPPISSNEALRSILEGFHSKLVLHDVTPRLLAENIMEIAEWPERDRGVLGNALRAYVIEHHSLDRLSKLLIDDVL